MKNKREWILYSGLTLISALFLFISCQKDINPNAIYGYWSLENKVDFGDMAFTHLEFYKSSEGYCCAWIDPVIYDTIYHYTDVVIEDNELILKDDGDRRCCFVIEELHDSILVISKFPLAGPDKDLVFKKIGDTQQKGNKRIEERLDISALPEDSLDINMKSALYYKYNKDRFVLSNDQVLVAHGILEAYMTETKNGKDEELNPLMFNDYLRFYTGGKNENNEICAYIYLDADCYTSSLFPYSYFKSGIPSVKDGGNRHIYATVNLENGKVVDFYFIDI